MNRRIGIVAVLALALSGCDFGGGGGGGGTGGGTGGGGESFTFTKGFAYVRKDDRNVYLADERDYQTSTTLTSTGSVHTPSLSKDGKRLVFVSGNGAEATLATLAVTGGLVNVVLSPTPTVKNFRSPVFSPDGTTIAFTYDDGGVSSSIGLINVDGSNFVALAGGGALAYAMPSYSADGTSLLAAAGNAGLQLTQIERIVIATRQTVNVTNSLGLEALAIASRLALSADGTKAVFDARLSSGALRLFVIDLASKSVTKVNEYVGEASANDSYPCWLDADNIAYSSDSGGNDNLYRIGINGLSRKLLLPKAIEPWFGP